MYHVYHLLICIFLPMAPTTKEKAQKRKRRRRCCFWGFCCSEGAVPAEKNNAISSSSNHHNHYDDRKSFKKYSQRNKTIPISSQDSVFAMISGHDHNVNYSHGKSNHATETETTKAKAKSGKLPAQLPALQTSSSKQNVNLGAKRSKNLADNARRHEFDKQSSRGLETWGNPNFKLSHSVSTVANYIGRKEKHCDELIDPIVGAVVVLLTLVVMLISGKVCAILCVAACFYFIPRVTPNTGHVVHQSHIIKTPNQIHELDSAECKKKVVLQGLLERNHYV